MPADDTRMIEIIGARIKKIRRQQKLTLAQLGEKVGISTATVSKIENGKIHPTFQNLIRMAEAFKMPLGDLVSPSEDTESTELPTGRIAVTRHSEIQFTRTPSFDIGPLCADLTHKRMNPIFERVLVTDLESGDQMVAHSGEEFLYVISGQIIVHSEFYAPIILNAGDSVYLDSRMAHTYVSGEGEPAEIIMVWLSPDERSSNPDHWPMVAASRRKTPTEA